MTGLLSTLLIAATLFGALIVAAWERSDSFLQRLAQNRH